jgi:ABC-type Fe3+ transport system substrate-binding protein
MHVKFERIVAHSLYLLPVLTVFTLMLHCVAHGAAARPDWQAEWERTLQAAGKEGKVVVYTGGRGTYNWEKIFGEFEKKYPDIKVSQVSAGSGTQGGLRIMAERRAGKFLVDLTIGGASSIHQTIYKAKALDPIKPALILPEVTDKSKWWRDGQYNYSDEEQNYIFAFNGKTQSYFTYNSKLVDPNEFKSYWDLLNPKWKGKMVAFDPAASGSAAVPLRLLYYSPELGPQFLRKLLGEMDLAASRDTTQIVNWLATGKYAISIFTAIDNARIPEAKKQGLPVDWFAPKTFKEGVILSLGSGNVSLINRAPHPNAARVLLNWLLAREAQILYQRIDLGQDSQRIDIPKDEVPEYSRRVEGVNYVVTEQPKWIDFEPITQLVNEVWQRRR